MSADSPVERRSGGSLDPFRPASTLAVLLRGARQQARLTQEELAERSGLSVRTISDLERERVRRPQRHSLRALTRALGLADQRLDELLRTARSRDQAITDPVAPPPRLGPQPCRQRLAGLLAAAAHGAGGPLMVWAGPGAHRGELLDDLVARARRGGCVTLRGSGALAECALPYASLHLLLTPVLAELARLDEHPRATLRGALGLAGPVPAHPTAVAVATLDLVRHLSTRAPVLLVVDDAQWLDEASAAVLFFLARRLAGTRAALVLAGPPAAHRVFGSGALPLSGIPEVILVADR